MASSFMTRGLFPRVADVKNLGFGLGFVYQLQRLQGMLGPKQGEELCRWP